MSESVTSERVIQSLIDLVSNTTDAYTAALFLAPSPDRPLYLAAYQSLSRSIDLDVRIAAGEGLIGYVHKYQQALNVDQFDRDTRQLLLYRADENIKSFMAVPLPGARGVLAVDSKQRYVFPEKSQKILHQYAGALGLVLTSLEQAGDSQRLSESLSFVLGLENVLGRSHQPAGVWSEALALIREYSGAAAGFVTALLPGNPDQYLVTAQNPVADQRLDKDLWPVKSGLAGWVMQNQKPLVLERARLGSERSYVFYPDEPFKNLPGFIGLPLFHAGRLRGAVLLVGEQAFSLSRFSLENLELAADRLGAHLEMELLIERINELSRLDPQVGLPHRSYFTRRLSGLTRKLKGRQVLGLLVLQIANLEDIIVDRGPEAAQEVLRAAARRLLSAAAPDHELGHLSFGAIGVAVPGATESDVRAVTDELTARFSKRKYETSAGIVELSIRSAFGLYPGQARRAEELVRLCLTKINT